jgi:hypothetical protein
VRFEDRGTAGKRATRGATPIGVGDGSSGTCSRHARTSDGTRGHAGANARRGPRTRARWGRSTRQGVRRPELHQGSATRKALTWHDLRATGITWMAVRGDDPLKIKQRAGHASFQTTEIYIREAEAVREGFGAVFPPLPKSLISVAPRDESSGESSSAEAGRLAVGAKPLFSLLRGLDLNQRPSGYEAKTGPSCFPSQRSETIQNQLKAHGIGRHRGITGRHARSRDLRSPRQPRVNGKITGKILEGFARRWIPSGSSYLSMAHELAGEPLGGALVDLPGGLLRQERGALQGARSRSLVRRGASSRVRDLAQPRERLRRRGTRRCSVHCGSVARPPPASTWKPRLDLHHELRGSEVAAPGATLAKGLGYAPSLVDDGVRAGRTHLLIAQDSP